MSIAIVRYVFQRRPAKMAGFPIPSINNIGLTFETELVEPDIRPGDMLFVGLNGVLTADITQFTDRTPFIGIALTEPDNNGRIQAQVGF